MRILLLLLSALAAVILAVVLALSRSASSGVRHSSSPVGGSTTSRASRTLAVPRVVQESASRELGEMIIARVTGIAATTNLLERVRDGQVGGVILFAENFAAGTARAEATIAELQAAAKKAGTWPLLIMTDQEGGEVRRIPTAPPDLAAREMTSVAVAHREGLATGLALRRLGINVDLAPVSDVEELATSFLGSRAFGVAPSDVAPRACAFARGIAQAGIAYTLKHFPGLGTAATSTDVGPVSVMTTASQLRANYAAYRRCGRGPRTLVMVSSAGYPALTGNEMPAVMSSEIYRREFAQAQIKAVTISDDLQAGALASWPHPALDAVNAGLDLALYAQTPQASEEAYEKLQDDLRVGALNVERVREASSAIRALKAALAR